MPEQVHAAYEASDVEGAPNETSAMGPGAAGPTGAQKVFKVLNASQARFTLSIPGRQCHP